MFYEVRQVDRESIRFPFKGSELLVKAKELRSFYRYSEMQSRDQLASLLRDANVRADDDRTESLKHKIAELGKQYEACCVYVAGFEREPERSFTLSLGDCVYFGLESRLTEGEKHET